MTSNINGNALTLEQKVLRAFEAKYYFNDGISESQLKARFERLSRYELLELISEALEEMFEPIGHGK